MRQWKEVEEADKMASSVASSVFGAIRMVAACGAEEKMVRLYGGWVEEARRREHMMSPIVAIQQAPGKLQHFNQKNQSPLCSL